MFNALTQLKVERLASKYQEMRIEKSIYRSYRRQKFRKNGRYYQKSRIFEHPWKNEAFNVLFSQIIDDIVGTEAIMTICFINDVSSLLALVSVVREKTFE